MINAPRMTGRILAASTLALASLETNTAFADDAYIQSSGVQAVNTGYFANPETRIVADFQFMDTSGQARVFGADNTTDHANGGIGLVSCSLYVNGANTKFAYAMKDGVGQWTTMADKDTERHTYVLDTSKVHFITGGTTNFTGNINRANVTRTSDWPLAVFANCRSPDFSYLEPGQFGKLRLYALRIYDGATPVHYFLPYVKDGVTGLRDAITGSVYTDYRGAAFAYGGDIGVYEGYNAADCPPQHLHSDFAVIGGKLVDMSYGCYRDNNGTLEYRVRTVGRLCAASIDGGAAASVADKWIPYGTSATIALSAQTGSGRSFAGWRSDDVEIPAESAGSAALSLTVSGPCVVEARARSLAEPYSDAQFWMRSMGSDVSGDGLVQAGELFDSLGETDIASLATVYNSPAFTNELVRRPYAGTRGAAGAIYLPQAITWTDETTGTVKVDTVQLAGSFAKFGVTDASFTIAVRFRPDAEMLRRDYCWLMNCGYDGSTRSGFMIGLSNPTVSTNTYTVGTAPHEKEFTKYTLGFFRNGSGAASIGGAVWSDCWHDLIISVDGSTVRWMLTRAGFDGADLPEGVTAKSISDVNRQVTYRQEFDIGDGNSAVPADGKAWILGAEGNSGATHNYDSTQENGGLSSSAVSTKCFRGSYNQIALWNRSMDFDEMGATLAWPRQDVARIGVENGSEAEFAGGAAARQDDPRWTMPGGLAAGDAATFKFGLADGLAGVPQRFTWISAPESASGSIRLSINGGDCGVKDVGAATRATWQVAKDVLVAGTNTVVLSRADAGSGTVALDAATLGGSWQVGFDDGTFYDLGLETTVATNSIAVADGNFHDYPRAYFGSVGGDSRYTNAVFRFSFPQGASGGNVGARLVFRTVKSTSSAHADHVVRWSLNGSEIYSAQSDDGLHAVPLPSALLRADNALELSNGGVFASGKYFGLDFVRVELRFQDGTTIVFR